MLRSATHFRCNAAREPGNAIETQPEPNDYRREAHRLMTDAWLGIHFPFGKGAVMNSKVSMMKSMVVADSKVLMMKSLVVAVALAAGISSMARADSDMSRIGGDSYAYFSNAAVDKAPSAWRQANPNGLSERQVQAEASSSVASAYQPAVSVFDKAPSEWRQTHPNGLTEAELQAISSEGPAWHPFTQPAISSVASRNPAAVVMSANE
jgi:hypothetical protein